VTFLFTDIEGSTRLWQLDEVAMREALARHDALLRTTISDNGGRVFATGGDGLAAAFSGADAALKAAEQSQKLIGAEEWETAEPIRVRMGLHSGEAEERDGDFLGPAVNRAARVMSVGHGGQVLVSAATAAVAGAHGLVDLGEHELAGLAAPERIFQLGSERFPPLRSVGAVPSNLPPERSAFVGRERELGVVAGLLRSSRMVTLNGVGGVGKTRLAVHTAATVLGEFPDGVWLVELAPLIDATLVASTVANAIGTPPSRGVEPREMVCRFLAHKRALLVLDNCEHVIDVAAGFVDELLGAAPRTQVLATSREPLDVAGESVWRVPSLAVETTSGELGDAVALFLQRAGQVHGGIALDDDNRETVVQLCRRLDGIPLAIELAAARAGTMSVQHIADHLDERFRLLTRGGRTAVARQQTLQGAFDWSYELLTPPERELFDLLGVFAGGFDLKAAAAVAGLDEYRALDVVGQLVDKSMVEVDLQRDRYRLLETLRQYAWDRLVSTGRLSSARRAHADWFSAVAGTQAARMGLSGQQVDALDRLETDYDNLRAALAHLVEDRRGEAAARLVRRLLGLFNIRHPLEGLSWFEQVLAIADGLPERTRAQLLADAGYAAMSGGDFRREVHYAQAAIDVAGDDAPPVAHMLLAQTATDSVAAAEHARVALAAGDLTTRILAASILIAALAGLGDGEVPRSSISQTIGSADELGNPTITGAVSIRVAGALLTLGERGDAVLLVERGLADADAGGPVIACNLRAMYALLIDDPDKAVAALLTAIPIATDQLGAYNQRVVLVAAAKVLAQNQHQQLAARLLGTYEQHRRASEVEETIFGRWLDTQEGWWDFWPRILIFDGTFTPSDQELEVGAQLSLREACQLAYDTLMRLSARAEPRE
jgi:predicted ATPase